MLEVRKRKAMHQYPWHARTSAQGTDSQGSLHPSLHTFPVPSCSARGVLLRVPRTWAPKVPVSDLTHDPQPLLSSWDSSPGPRPVTHSLQSPVQGGHCTVTGIRSMSQKEQQRSHPGRDATQKEALESEPEDLSLFLWQGRKSTGLGAASLCP